jgi:hypothetical protein
MLDCTTCGACCAWSDTWPEFTEESDRHMEGIPMELCDCDNGRMACDGNRCRALEGRIGEKVACTIYPYRPLVCRQFQPGGQGCLIVRKGLGIKEAANS